MAALLECAGCRARYRVSDPKPGRTYKCSRCGGRLENPAPGPSTPAPRQGLRLQGESERRVWEIPVRLGRYVIDGEVGRGAMGVVYRARQEGLDRAVAIKMMLVGWAQDEQAKRRFQREARAAARLRHPNIVAIHEVGTYRGAPFFTMDYIDGVSLERRLTERPLAPREAARLVRELALAMHHAHGHGILHRDLKPSNILIDSEGVPHITDFGLAKDLNSQSMLSVTGDVMGTPGYMAPEQAEGNVHDLDARVDVYALGAVLYRCLCGRPPFVGPTAASTIYQIINELAVEPVKLRKDIPADLNAIVVKAIEKDRSRRYAAAADLAQDLDNFLHGRPVAAAPPRRGRVLWFRLQRHRAWVVAAAAAGLVAVAAVAALLLLRPSALEQLRAQLQSANPATREAALRGLLEEIARPDAIDDAAAAARVAARYAREHGDVTTRTAVVELLEGEGMAERLWAEFGPAVRAWLPQSEPPDLCVRKIRLVGRVRDREAIDLLVTLTRLPNREIKVAATEALGQMRDPRALPRLAELMVDPDAGAVAREGMRQLSLERWLGFSSAAGQDVTGALAQVTEAMQQYGQQLEQALDPSRPTPEQEALQALRTGTVEQKIRAAMFLAEHGDAEAVEPLYGALEAGPESVAVVAAEALARLGAAGRDRMGRLLREGPVHARAAAAFALGRAEGAQALPVLQEALTVERDPAVRRAILEAMNVATGERQR